MAAQTLGSGDFARRVVDHFRHSARDLPWRRTRDPYAIWVSEIMLQQTRVATVIPYYERWLERFPTIRALATAPLDDVLAAWAGLGYYSRARNLHRGAREVVARYGGRVPRRTGELRELPGVGRYTAGAIASQAFDARAAVVDGNVARVLARVYELEDDIKSSRGQRVLWELAESLVPADAAGEFNQGLMELGATVCTPTSPACLGCPLSEVCGARATGRQHELPVMPRRRRANELPVLDRAAGWIERRGAVLLTRRVPSGLYGGMWELPSADRAGELGAAVGRAVRVLTETPTVIHEQILSHRKLRITLWPARITRGTVRPDPARYDAFAWQPVDALDERALSAATTAVVTAHLEHI